MDDAGMICSAVVARRSNLSRSHAGLRGTGTQGPARGATISRSTVHCQSKATSWLNERQPGSLCAAIFIKGGIRETQFDPGPGGHVGRTGPVTFPQDARARSAIRPVQKGDWCSIDHDHFGGGGSEYCRRSDSLTTRTAPYDSGPPTSIKQDRPRMPQ